LVAARVSPDAALGSRWEPQIIKRVLKLKLLQRDFLDWKIPAMVRMKQEHLAQQKVKK
jgi:hypothetical protein